MYLQRRDARTWRATKTSTIQVVEEYTDGYAFIVKQYQYKIGDHKSREKAIEKANKFIDDDNYKSMAEINRIAL